MQDPLLLGQRSPVVAIGVDRVDGVGAVGVGGAIDWKTTEQLTTSVFAEYSRLTGPAGDSSLVEQRGSPNQYLFGVSATYRFDFQL